MTNPRLISCDHSVSSRVLQQNTERSVKEPCCRAHTTWEEERVTWSTVEKTVLQRLWDKCDCRESVNCSNPTRTELLYHYHWFTHGELFGPSTRPSIHPTDHPSTRPSIQRLICPHYPGSRWAKRSNSIIAAHTQDSVCPGKMSQRSQENWLGYFLTIISTGLQCGAPLSPTGILELIFWLSAGMDKGKSGVRIRLSLCRSASEKPQLTTLWRMVRNAAAPLQETPLTTSCFPAVSLPNNLYIFHVE